MRLSSSTPKCIPRTSCGTLPDVDEIGSVQEASESEAETDDEEASMYACFFGHVLWSEVGTDPS